MNAKKKFAVDLARYCEAASIDLDEPTVAKLSDYANLVRKWNRIANLIGAGTLDDLITPHFGDCLIAMPHIQGSNIIDVGSGAGFPGLVLAICRPEDHFSLVESRNRKTRFLKQVAIELQLTNVTVVAKRIESFAPSSAPDCVVCRGYSSLSKFHDDTQHLHREGLRLCAMKAALDEQECHALESSRRRVETRVLNVPGYDARHLVTVTCLN